MKERIIFAIALFMGLVSSFLSMLEWNLNILTSLFEAPFSAAGLGNGFLLIFNRLFSVSEAHQLFRYTMFHISSPQVDWAGNIAAAFVAVMAILAGISYALAATRRRVPLIIFMFAVVGVQVYFGVFPGAVWNIALFAVLSFMLAHRQNMRLAYRGIAVSIILLCLVALAVWVVYPHRNMRLHEFSESIRDRFDTPISTFVVVPHEAHNIAAAPQHHDLNVAAVSDDALHEMPTEDYFVEYDERAQGAEIGFAALEPSLLYAIILVVFVMVAAVLYRFVPPMLKAVRRRRFFESAAVNIALNNMFIYLLEWLAIIGLEKENVLFSAYKPRLAALVSPQYAHDYERMTALWQKAVYSNQTMGENERKQMREFLQNTKNFVWQGSSLVTKLRIKFEYFL
jgi:hypothetical protein